MSEKAVPQISEVVTSKEKLGVRVPSQAELDLVEKAHIAAELLNQERGFSGSFAFTISRENDTELARELQKANIEKYSKIDEQTLSHQLRTYFNWLVYFRPAEALPFFRDTLAPQLATLGMENDIELSYTLLDKNRRSYSSTKPSIVEWFKVITDRIRSSPPIVKRYHMSYYVIDEAEGINLTFGQETYLHLCFEIMDTAPQLILEIITDPNDTILSKDEKLQLTAKLAERFPELFLETAKTAYISRIQAFLSEFLAETTQAETAEPVEPSIVVSSRMRDSMEWIGCGALAASLALYRENKPSTHVRDMVNSLLEQTDYSQTQDQVTDGQQEFMMAGLRRLLPALLIETDHHLAEFLSQTQHPRVLINHDLDYSNRVIGSQLADNAHLFLDLGQVESFKTYFRPQNEMMIYSATQTFEGFFHSYLYALEHQASPEVLATFAEASEAMHQVFAASQGDQQMLFDYQITREWGEVLIKLMAYPESVGMVTKLLKTSIEKFGYKPYEYQSGVSHFQMMRALVKHNSDLFFDFIEEMHETFETSGDSRLTELGGQEPLLLKEARTRYRLEHDFPTFINNLKESIAFTTDAESLFNTLEPLNLALDELTPEQLSTLRQLVIEDLLPRLKQPQFDLGQKYSLNIIDSFNVMAKLFISDTNLNFPLLVTLLDQYQLFDWFDSNYSLHDQMTPEQTVEFFFSVREVMISNPTNFGRVSYFQRNSAPFTLIMITRKLLDKDPAKALDLIKQLETDFPFSTELNQDKLLALVLSDKPNEEAVNLQEKISLLQQSIPVSNNNQFNYYAGLQTIYVDQTHPEIINRNMGTLQQLTEINATLPSNKQAKDISGFLTRYQEAIAKLQLILPLTNHANQFLLETAKVHGFERLGNRLEMMTSFSMNNILQLTKDLAQFPKGEMTQAVIYDMITLHATYFNRELGIGQQWQVIWDKFSALPTLEKSLQVVRNELAKGLLRELAKSLGIDESLITDASINEWNLDYLPKIIEGTHNFDEYDKLMFSIIVKATFEGKFREIIDPHYPLPDANHYSEEELDMITAIKRHNRLTVERFAARGLNYYEFQAGSAQEMTGHITATERITNAWDRVKISLLSALDETSQRFSNEVTRVKTEIDELLADVDQVVSDALFVKTPTETGTLDQAFYDQLLYVIRNLLGSRDKSFTPLLNPELATQLQKGNYLRFLKYDQGRVVGVTNPTTVKQRLEELSNHLLATSLPVQEEGRGQEISKQIGELLTQLEAAQKVTVKPSRTPSLKSLTVDVSKKIDELGESISSQIDNFSQSERDEIVIILDHLRVGKNDVNALPSIVTEAKDMDYHVKIRRWGRRPGVDLPQGNYTNCCVAIDSFNGYAILRYLCLYGLELNEVISVRPDGSEQNIGQTFDFIDETNTGDLNYQIDNGELVPEFAAIDSIIRAGAFKSSQETSHRMSTQPRIKEINMGTSYNDLPVYDLERKPITMRMLAGNNLGLKYYLDTFVKHTSNLDVVRSPLSFQSIYVYKVPVTLPPAEIEPARLLEPRAVELIPTTNETWSAIKSEVIALEEDIFSLIGENESQLEAEFTQPDSIAAIVRDTGNTIIGYSIGLDAGTYKAPSETPASPPAIDENAPQPPAKKMLYIRSSAVGYEYQRKGLAKQLLATIENEAKRLGYEYVSRNAMADTNYAQGLITKALEQGTLVEPAPQYNEQGQPDLQKTLAQAELNSYYGRTQMYIVTKL